MWGKEKKRTHSTTYSIENVVVTKWTEANASVNAKKEKKEKKTM